MYVVVALGAVLAGFVQGLSGFAFGMVSMSVWVWVLEPRLAAVLAVFGAMMGQVVAAVTVRRGFSWSLLLPSLDMTWFKLILGCLLVLWCPAMLMARHLPQVSAGGRLADALVGMAGGVMGGLGGFTGVLPTLWCTVRGYPKDTQRTVIQNFNLSMLTVTMGSYLAAGLVTSDMLPMFAIVAPAMLVPTLIGTKLYIGISEVRFRQLVLGLLTASGVALLASSIPLVLAR
ncbi:sulfite exporter TauE/SafE family protein [Bordetella holmesii]|uniref:Probable membrane transporter protein n=1 Tax=Bordetella holmesii CDC-H585-BH TaxID=1331206 RepID=A0A158M390_9BORD|nr:sulfite exporter TauE/SafE family protein [Bordetella holmesii]AHV91857.1 sulfite exporter TauE/SafE family protein [Bordetella holmesii ATCC 51541]AIT27850.1 sulfite exporter TauE/SafE family protein [Bordetella holmesii 44057]EWM40629.1 sulfite exporter TauE/SafE family protein [Bordetella holmesii 35009]EWM44526.1 sulfite exporter TauE/SafE family protein [Bordetella holmesii 70147]AMD46611.1 permease [Bordetella holmesii H558]